MTRSPQNANGVLENGTDRPKTGNLLQPNDHFWGRKPMRFGLPVLFVLAGIAALSIDVPMARWCLDDRCPHALAKICSLAEVFGHGLGVAMIILAACVLDPAGRRFVPRIVAASFGAGLLADVLKLTVARDRPKHFSFHGGVAETFGQWLPLFGHDSGIQSFPSSHVAVAVGLAIALAWRYPRGRWLFAALACLTAGQRLTSGAHFVSDVCWGAAVGCVLAPSCLPGGVLDPLFTWYSALFDGRSRTAPLVPGEPAATPPADRPAQKSSAQPRAA